MTAAFFVVLELFTSQGCSSCPPADRVLSEIGDQPNVIALAYHVDYWNYIGWADPYSAPQYSERQRAYAQARRSRGVYTPQLVVNGDGDLVGSHRDQVAEIVRKASPLPVAVKPEVRVVGDVAEVRADVTATRDQVVLVALTESGLATAVPRGENSGKKLTNDHVVRRLEELAPGGARLALGANAERRRLAVVVLVQDRRTLRIVGAARVPLKP